MTWTLLEAHRWADHGTKLLDEQISTLSEVAAREPSGLPGWTRKALIAHICGNADALGNLVRWAATGVETPMYASREQRQKDIDAGDTMTTRELLSWFGRSVGELAHAMDRLTSQQWESPVVTAQGRTVPATTIPWLRAREVMVHAVDLGTGATFADLPTDFLVALSADIVTKRTGAADYSARPGVKLVADNVALSFDLDGGNGTQVVHGELAAVAAYLAGRPNSCSNLVSEDGAAPPDLPPWL